jgi:predicted aspartyl protease
LSRCPLRRLLAYASLLPLAACANSSGPGCVQVQSANLPVTFTAQGLPIVDVVVAGQTLHMLVDTGAEMTIITPAGAKKIPSSLIDGGIIRMEGVNGSLDSQARSVQLMRFGGISVQDQEIFISKLAISDNENNEIDGSIGEDILQNFNIGLDFPHHRLDLFSRDRCASAFPWSGQFAPLPFPASQNGPKITFYINAQPITGMVDTGASRFSVQQKALTQAGVVPDKIGDTTQSVGIGGLTGTDTRERFDVLTIGGEVFDSTWIVVRPHAYYGEADALIGESYLHTHQVYINNATNTVWLGTTVAPN